MPADAFGEEVNELDDADDAGNEDSNEHAAENATYNAVSEHEHVERILGDYWYHADEANPADDDTADDEITTDDAANDAAHNPAYNPGNGTANCAINQVFNRGATADGATAAIPSLCARRPRLDRP